MAIKTKNLTYEDYLELPEIKQRYEIIDGELIMTAAPNIRHQKVSKQIFLPLNEFVSDHDLGEVFYAPVDILLHKKPLRTRQPDIMYISKERADIIRDQVEGAPDLAIEMLSPSNTRSDVLEKLADYARIGILECWIVSTQAESVEVLKLVKGRYKRQGIFGLGDKIKSTVLPGLALMVDEIFK